MLLVKALEARKRQEERERMREEKSNEKRINRQRKFVSLGSPPPFLCSGPSHSNALEDDIQETGVEKMQVSRKYLSQMFVKKYFNFDIVP
jgi:hypothetical protein